ncbi:hypothetical protein AC244_27305 [Ensifer adhaerens]|uniref:AB hydrolase-1 domain-containing protein n=1 Tax=Ensifer adhaerens TaxID=106592 RepID=A0A0L8BI57_ENSAD|nr:alpha/beta hydrolase [Ensifer adhaerens]KOF14352.1 hypothetical protein AC244_27305 [Ensifer adhaerens]
MDATVSSASLDFWVPSQEAWANSKKRVELPNGMSMAYTDFGDPSGAPLLLIHGYTDNSRAWSLNGPYLRGRRLIAIDLRGHGQSSVTDTYSVDELANDVALFIDKLGLGKIDVAGHSLGSITAQVLAAFYPDKVNSIVLVNSTLKVNAGPGEFLWDTVMDLSYPLDPDGALMSEWFWNPTPIDPTFLHYSIQEAARTDERTWRGVLRALSTTDLAPIQSLIKAKVMIIWGDLDPLFDLGSQEALRAVHPDAEILTIEGAGHNPNWEHPEKVAKAILRFLAR